MLPIRAPRCCVGMPIVESLSQTQCPRPSSAHYQNMHNLVTRTHDIEGICKPAFWDTSRVEGSASHVQQAKNDEIRHRLPLILHFPAVDDDPVGDWDEYGEAEERIHRHAHIAVRWRAELMTYG